MGGILPPSQGTYEDSVSEILPDWHYVCVCVSACVHVVGKGVPK